MLVDTIGSESYVINIASSKYKGTTVFDNFDMGACQLVLDRP